MTYLDRLLDGRVTQILRAMGGVVLAGLDDIRRHSGVGRIGRLRMRTMSLSETGRSTRQVSLQGLRDGESLSGIKSDLSFRGLADEAIRGGWPALVEASIADAMEFNNTCWGSRVFWADI